MGTLILAALIGLFLGTFSARLAIGWSSLYLLLLPVSALVAGVTLRRRSAMFATGALLIGNTLWATWPLPDPVVILWTSARTIVLGGVGLFLVTAAGGLLRTRRSSGRFAAAVMVFGGFFGWTLFLAFPRWSHTYQVTVKTDAPLETLTVVLPMPMLQEERFVELLDDVYYARPQGPHDVRTKATDHGEMVVLEMALGSADIPWAAPKQPGYNGNVIFRDQGTGWRRHPELGQRQQLGFILADDVRIFGGPFKREKSRITTRYQVPAQAVHEGGVSVDVTLRLATDVWSFVSYSQEKWWSQTDEVVAAEIPGDAWVNVEVLGRERIWLSRILD